MGRQGRKRRLEIEDDYWNLIIGGVGTVEACRRVGIGRKTGYRWRAEHGGSPPARVIDAVRGRRYLSRFERQRIATLREQGLGVREIARRVERSPSTISRELRRNVAPHDGGIYDSDLAHARAQERASRRRTARLAADDELRAVVQDKLELEWSPEQISAWLRLEHADRRDWHLCHETIYQSVYNPARGGLSRHFTKKLRTGRPLRKRRRRANQRAVRFVAPAKSIAHRPRAAAARVRVGDWEGDLIMGRSSHSAIGTLVERRSSYVVLLHLPNGHDSEAVRDALVEALGAMPTAIRKTLTWDQGSEMSRHDEIAHLLSEGVYFADAGRPWQRGCNENTNGLLRQYFPKRTDLSVHSAEHLAAVAHRLNTRPRKRLGWRTPAEVLGAHLRS